MRITLAHGNGGIETHKLINEMFYKYFNSEILENGNDAAIIENIQGKIFITTDSFVINPIFFKGGDIGKLSVCGTINDLAVSFAKPLYITVSLIIEEGFLISDLEKIIKSISEEAKKNDVKIICGDTKVVEKGKGDKIYINTTGIGVSYENNLKNRKINIGDKVIISGTIGDHGTSILCEREEIDLNTNIKSDCQSLCKLTEKLIYNIKNIKVMTDPTRGGVITTLKEICNLENKNIKIYENKLPIRNDVKYVCDMVGMDPLYMANEGKLICIVGKEESLETLKIMKCFKYGKNAKIIGEVIEGDGNELYYETELGSVKTLYMLSGELVPRIC
ncbi:hydrogenase expression/formation protein HypE [Clostridium sp. Ade.TY]|uniref:hydrogenase expression/formation protein HypE n=1 Tax=Clostridium sp. Ade.TY TaxID=1391647 RepID=UPI00041F47BB|nr:hydrogenase expression/formation protein HypE [Clostridium sp. Ade.TY]